MRAECPNEVLDNRVGADDQMAAEANAARHLSPVQALELAIDAAQDNSQLSHIAQSLWRAFSGGTISEPDAERLQAIIDSRRPASRAAAFIAGLGAKRPPVRRFRPRVHQRPLDRAKALERRRMLAGSSALPPEIRADYTEGHRAVLAVISLEIKERGGCSKPIAELAARAGVSRSTAQEALRRASANQLIVVRERPQPGAKNLTNVITISSARWRRWIGPRKLSPTESQQVLNEQTKQTEVTRSLDRQGEQDCSLPAPGRSRS